MRERVASQVNAIKHWRVIEADYAAVSDIEATWFVDPPYQLTGYGYVHSSKAMDFATLATWCRSRRGQIIMCENPGADWLPFAPFGSVTGMSGAPSREAIWWQDSARTQELLPLAASPL